MCEYSELVFNLCRRGEFGGLYGLYRLRISFFIKLGVFGGEYRVFFIFVFFGF